MTSSIWQSVKSKDWTSFFRFFWECPVQYYFTINTWSISQHRTIQGPQSLSVNKNKTYLLKHIYEHKKRHWRIVTQVLHRRGRYYLVYLCTLVILNSADCHPNPDPQVSLEYPRFVCGKEVLDDHTGIHCDDYHCGYHTSCINTVNNT